MKKYLVVANCNGEAATWSRRCGISKDWQVFPHPHLFRPQGRECTAYLDFICTSWFEPSDEIVFCQGNPFPHDQHFLEHLEDDSIRYYGPIHECDPTGLPHEPGLDLHAWSEVLGLPKLERYRFIGGTQFRVSGDQLLGRPHRFWNVLYRLCELPYSNGKENRASWQLERLWPVLLRMDLNPAAFAPLPPKAP